MSWQVDYFVDCHYSGEGERLWVVGGTNKGSLGYFPVKYKEGGIGSPEAVLEGGHTGVVRSVLAMTEDIKSGAEQSQGVFGWTGGEDGRLSCWLSDHSSDTNSSWISSELVVKTPKTRKKNRLQPY